MMKWISRLFRTSPKEDASPLGVLFTDTAKENVARSQIFRSAATTVSMNRKGKGRGWPTFQFGVFAIMGHEHAERVANTSNPRERRLLEEISMAAHNVEVAARQMEGVPDLQAKALIARIRKWYAYIKVSGDDAAMWQGVQKYVSYVLDATESEED